MDLANARVLVTGADGFIRSHLVEHLLAAGARVRALVQYNSFSSWGWLEALPDPSGVDVVAGDVRDAHCCDELVEAIDGVFHLATLTRSRTRT